MGIILITTVTITAPIWGTIMWLQYIYGRPFCVKNLLKFGTNSIISGYIFCGFDGNFEIVTKKDGKPIFTKQGYLLLSEIPNTVKKMNVCDFWIENNTLVIKVQKNERLINKLTTVSIESVRVKPEEESL